MAYFVTSSVLVAVVCVVVYAILFVGHRGRDYPPGPPTLPLVGNVHQIPKTGAHFKFAEWARQYGGIFSLKLGPGNAIVLTDRRLVKELVDKKSAIYSHRPTSYILQNLVTQGDYMLLMDYDSEWRKFRKLVAQQFTESMCEKEHVKLVNAEAAQMMRDMVVEPENYMLHPRRYSNSVVMSVLYGIRTPTIRTAHMERLYEMLTHFQGVTEFGALPPVDFYPFLRYLPEQLLGNWRTRATMVHGKMIELYADLVDTVRRRRQEHGSRGSLIDNVLDNQEKLGMNEHQVCFLGGVAMDGGSDTSGVTILSFMKAMTCYPEVQKKAQAQIDSLMNADRSPTWSDYQNLPYISGVVKESMRWRPVGGLIPPHATSEDDWVDGKFVPKGTIVLINAWGLHQDENYFPDADRFEPARYAGRTLLAPDYAASPDYESRDHYIYGAGRRLCPGIHLAERNLFIAMAKLLWAFSFEKVVDEKGRVQEPDTNYATGWNEGLVTCTKDFPCRVVPRSAERVDTIMREFAQAEADVLSKYG